MVSLDAFKGIAMASIFAVAMLGGFAPFLVARLRSAARDEEQPAHRPKACSPERVLPVLNMASAGVFLSAGLLHLLADAISNEELSELSEDFWGEEGGSRHAIALCVAGLVFLICVEQLGHAQLKQPGGCCGDPEDPGRESVEPLYSATSSESETITLDRDSLVSRPTESVPQEQTARAAAAPAHSSSAAVALTVGIALSLHSVLEGLALGAQEELEQSIGIFIAILAHKGIAAFALGNKVVNHFEQVAENAEHGGSWALSFGACMTLFSVATPAGIAIAWGVTAAVADLEEHPYAAALSAVGAGTFLFVATVEVIPAELSADAEDRAVKLLALVLGAVLMGGLALWV
jgi:zinc transporter 1/2/3